MKKKYILKNKKRFFSFIFILSLITFILIYTNAVSGYKEPQYQSIIVNSGDTLWSIAEKYGSNQNIREYIYNLKKINNLESSLILENTAILIPSDDTSIE
ncbi:LysM peptidoglycan-binding domain-containing protein [Ruminiclostridium herbifermentans]|uniref:LysM peptidoglycan-binding domain-containing protein n=1 Tax=Ruminiclostridium herbifermentans TaxID=2488810 RepID=A0A4U7JMP1_9FIRM|nr:LysM peptidoglycan-binding domain-containing protein [Ruminiclostridium herbifermentans]QNU65286.1 LysM peptidoglycan-binding domain-containing protein [Ruminiclostridium herbifermentans]